MKCSINKIWEEIKRIFTGTFVELIYNVRELKGGGYSGGQ